MNWGYLWRCINRAASFRLMFSAFACFMLTGVSLGWLLGTTVAGVLGIIVGGLVYVGGILNDANVLDCPKCRKMVKIGAVRCHHCGWEKEQTPSRSD